MRGTTSAARLVVVLLFAALASFQIVRTAAVADRESHPAWAAALWPAHPAVLTDRVLLAIAAAAARGQGVPPEASAETRLVAARAPLSANPFLVEGAIAETQGNSEVAERLLLEARSRDPRSRGTRYLLAERFFRTGRITDALIEMQALISLHARGGEPFRPALVAYARTPGAIPQLKAFFRKYPRVEAGVLSELAADAANADLVLALANVREPDPDWRGTLVTALASAGQFARARAVWARLSGVSAAPGLYNPDFESLPPPPPFNWSFPASGEGVAEPDGKGGLDVLYYGRTPAMLASQLMLLEPGRYRLAMTGTGAKGQDGSVHWFLRCADRDQALAALAVRPGDHAVMFDVPSDCAAQWLELRGRPDDVPRTSELTVRNLGLTRVADR